jgi:hypothetical protein
MHYISALKTGDFTTYTCVWFLILTIQYTEVGLMKLALSTAVNTKATQGTLCFTAMILVTTMLTTTIVIKNQQK